ncbi:MAG: cohesin domain-containing protein [Gammaproteobacteria bacterium]|nr:cohesin domain-containing protein [Gammaproteobacteria bacterium]MDH3413783.1 cohesin domain-containing protein [Gammaproteobacteria bacterium]
MRTRVRKGLLLAILAGTLALVVFDSSREGRLTRGPNPFASDVRSVDAGTGGSSQSGTGSDSRFLALPGRAQLADPRTNLFSSHSWKPPARKRIAVPPPPPAPSAPPMPYRYAGTLVQGDHVSILLSKGDSVFPIEEGETLDGAYRVESIGDTQVTLIYLPLKHKEIIPVFSLLLVAASEGRSDPAAVAGGGPAAPAAAVMARGENSAAKASTSAPPARSIAPSGAAQAESEPARLLWEGPQQVKLGARFDVALRVTSGQPVRASPMQLRFDPAYLEFVAAKPGRFFGGEDRSFNYRADPDGSIFVGASSENPAPVADAELVVLTFKPLKTALAAELSIASLNLQGPAGRPIAFGQLSAFKTTISQ